MNITTTSNSQILLLGLLFSWATVWVLIIPISLIVFLWSLIILYARKSKLCFYLIFLSPFVILPIFNAGIAVKDYVSGKAVLKYIGYPAAEFGNLDIKYRVYNHPEGCVVTGVEPLTHLIYNKVVKSCIHHFGYQKGSYTGIFPSKEDAFLLLSHEKTLGMVMCNGKMCTISVGNQNFNFNLYNQHGLILETILYKKEHLISKVKLMKNVLILQWTNKVIFIIDNTTNKILAQYLY